MAITKDWYRIFRELANSGVLKTAKGGSILEIGQATWYGDMSPCEMLDDIFPDRLQQEVKSLSNLSSATSRTLRRLAEIVYEIFLSPKQIVSIDLHGDEKALRMNLNEPPDQPPDRTIPIDLIINHGTAEHIFNIGQVFKTMHDYCKAGGLMIHESPWTGWIEHGFYNLQPTLYFDLAVENDYKIEAMYATNKGEYFGVESRERVLELARQFNYVSESTCLFVCLRKLSDHPFQYSMQGVYANRVSAAIQRAWQVMR
jgi:hypothetical protein